MPTVAGMKGTAVNRLLITEGFTVRIFVNQENVLVKTQMPKKITKNPEEMMKMTTKMMIMMIIILKEADQTKIDT